MNLLLSKTSHKQWESRILLLSFLFGLANLAAQHGVNSFSSSTVLRKSISSIIKTKDEKIATNSITTIHFESDTTIHSLTSLQLSTSSLSSSSSSSPYTIQILMSDTGGGHRASANALRDAFDSLYPGKIECDIVDIYTDYGPFWPFNWYVPAYKIMAEYSFLWKSFYEFGSTDLGLWLNEWILDVSIHDCHPISNQDHLYVNNDNYIFSYFRLFALMHSKNV